MQWGTIFRGFTRCPNTASEARQRLFLLFFFLFSFFLWTTVGFFLMFPFAFVFFSLITHICFSLFEDLTSLRGTFIARLKLRSQ